MTNFTERLNAADEKVHLVENEWHYKILTKYGYVPETKTQTGFIRKYKYVHPDGHVININHHLNCDMWSDPNNNKYGYWSTLDTHVNRLVGA